MAFCGKCGAQLEGNERFCVKCGNDLSAAGATAGASVAAAAAAPAAAPVAPPQAAPPPFAPFPQGYPGPGAVIPMAPPTQVKGRGWLWGVILVVAILYGLYYIGKHNQQTQTPGQNPTQQPGAAPGQQPVQGQPGAPDQQPGQDQQPNQGQQPGVGQQPYQGQQQGQGGNSALVQLQKFTGRWDNISGIVQISNALWRNNSNVTIQSATLECAQFAANGTMITHAQITLNGPLQPSGTDSFKPFTMGAIQPGLARVDCGIVGVTPAQ
ncbi:MAG: zinc ribbon domain-containing protein [Terracidiphilus sp.]|jgi:hypothetical protein